MLSENAVAVRTKAMKCLTAVVEADPGILARVNFFLIIHNVLSFSEFFFINKMDIFSKSQDFFSNLQGEKEYM